MKRLHIFKAVIVIIVVTLVMGTMGLAVSADTYIGSRDKDEGGFLWWGWTTYTYRAYFRCNMLRYWYGAPLSHIPYHVKYSGDETLSISQSQTITYSTTLSYNTSVGGQIGISELVSLSASMGYGVTTGMSFSSTTVRTYTKTISSSSKTGFYMLAPSQTEKECYWKKYKDSNTVYTGLTGTYLMPYGNASVACLYSTDNSSWGIFY